jgi:ABC-2 type transport system ATP-binding protein/lipopolysaccharide transport system ATP-binding protein
MSRIIADKLCLDFPIMTHASRSARNVAFKTMSRIGGHVINENGGSRLVRALDNIDLDLSAGDRIGLIGSNGSGKTTLIRTLAGIYHPSHGTLTVTGEHLPLFDINLGLDEEATGYENIFIRGLVMGMTRAEIEAKTESIAAYSELGSALDMSIRTYSAGMVLRLMFAIATSIEGDVVLMDEWLAVGDRSFREKANQRLRELVARTGILVLASHDMGLLRDICTLGLHLESGRVRNFGPIEEVIAAMEAGDNASSKGDEAA